MAQVKLEAYDHGSSFGDRLRPLDCAFGTESRNFGQDPKWSIYMWR